VTTEIFRLEINFVLDVPELAFGVLQFSLSHLIQIQNGEEHERYFEINTPGSHNSNSEIIFFKYLALLAFV